MDLSAFLPPQEAIQRLEAASLSPAAFEDKYDKPSQPVMLRGLTEGWEGELVIGLVVGGLLQIALASLAEFIMGISVEFRCELSLVLVFTQWASGPLSAWQGGWAAVCSR